MLGTLSERLCCRTSVFFAKKAMKATRVGYAEFLKVSERQDMEVKGTEVQQSPWGNGLYMALLHRAKNGGVIGGDSMVHRQIPV